MTAASGRRALVCLPTYNERENVEGIVAAVLAAVPELDILVVDDNSPDGTGALADALAAREPRVKVLHRAGKEGLGKAYLAGFAWALERGYALVLEMDADFSHDPRHLPAMLAAARDADLVLGSRYVPGGGTVNWGLGRKLLSRGGSLYARTLLGLRVRDLTGGFKCFRREVLQGIDLASVTCTGYAFQIELTYRAVTRGFRVAEVPIVFADRRVGQSKMSRRIVLEALRRVWTIRSSPFARAARAARKQAAAARGACAAAWGRRGRALLPGPGRRRRLQAVRRGLRAHPLYLHPRLLSQLLTLSLVSLSAMFFVVDPLSAVPFFLAMTRNADPARRRETALRASVTAGVVLAVFALGGDLIFRVLGISLAAFKVAGGVVLLLLALDMIRTQPSRTRITEGEVADGADKEDIAIVPLAMPLLAGPGSIATAIVLMARTRGAPIWHKAAVLGAILVTCAASYLILAGATRTERMLGRTGLAILERAAGLLLVAIAVQFMMDGLGEGLPRLLAG